MVTQWEWVNPMVPLSRDDAVRCTGCGCVVRTGVINIPRVALRNHNALECALFLANGTVVAERGPWLAP